MGLTFEWGINTDCGGQSKFQFSNLIFFALRGEFHPHISSTLKSPLSFWILVINIFWFVFESMGCACWGVLSSFRTLSFTTPNFVAKLFAVLKYDAIWDTPNRKRFKTYHLCLIYNVSQTKISSKFCLRLVALNSVFGLWV